MNMQYLMPVYHQKQHPYGPYGYAAYPGPYYGSQYGPYNYWSTVNNQNDAKIVPQLPCRSWQHVAQTTNNFDSSKIILFQWLETTLTRIKKWPDKNCVHMVQKFSPNYYIISLLKLDCVHVSSMETSWNIFL